MSYLALSTCVVLCLLPSASSAPLAGGQVATRDLPKGPAAIPSGLSLEKELQEKAEGHGETELLASADADRTPSDRSVSADSDMTSSDGRGTEVGPNDQRVQPAGNADAKDAEHRESSGESGGSEDTAKAADVMMADGSSPTEANLSAMDLSEEEEILRTIIMTLRDNPELIKALIDSETEEMQDEFYKQKARVSDNGDSDELWEGFQGPSPQVQQMPKQVEKKAGKAVYSTDQEYKDVPAVSLMAAGSGGQKADSPVEQTYPDDSEAKVENAGSSGVGSKADEDQNIEADMRIDPNPLNVLRPGKIVIPVQEEKVPVSVERSSDADKDRMVPDGSDVDGGQLAVDIGHSLTHPAGSGTSNRLPHRPQQTSAQTPAKVRGDKDENELVALLQASKPENKGVVRPHM